MAADVYQMELRAVRNGGDRLELDLLPLQGSWTEQQYLKLTDQTNHLIEFSRGVIEILPMPTDRHQAISQFLFVAFLTLMQRIGGLVRYSPLRLRTGEDSFREPDLLLLLDAADPRHQDGFWLGADLVVEIVSPDSVERDTVVKRAEYAGAGIPEYCIVSPRDETITVLTLAGTVYVEHGHFRRGDTATSALLEGFSVKIDEVLDAV